MKKKKKEYAIEHLQRAEQSMQCPKCHSICQVLESGTLTCTSGHQYDISKKGTIHFPEHAVKSDYDIEMLTHRRHMIGTGLYEPVLKKISDVLSFLEKDQLCVDMGSGEGSFLNELSRMISTDTVNMGYDLSKDAIQLSSDFSENAFWFVGDVTKMPFKNNSVHALLNILSPCQYQEINRVLHRNGYLIKVIPESFYLKELRELFYDSETKQGQYNNEKVYQKFVSEMKLVQNDRVTYSFPIQPEDFTSVLKMSPIHWGASEERRLNAEKSYFSELTIDVRILVGKKKD